MLITLLACNPDVTLDDGNTSEDGAIDLRVTDEDIGTLDADQFVLDGPEIVIEAGTDVMYCIYGTYTGPTVGMHDVHTFQGKFGHHFTLNGTSTPLIDAPDGTIVDCTSTNDQYQMADLEPLGVPNDATVDGQDLPLKRLALPDGMAVELESGARYLMQSHYLNTGPDPILIRDRTVITTIAPDDVETWAAPLVFNRGDFVIPAGGTATTSFRCTTDTDLNLLYMLAHMHEWGTSFRVDQVGVDESEGADPLPFFNVDPWDPVFRDAPPVLEMPDGPMAIPAGSTFETTCSWANDTDHDLVFPHEMCDTVSVVYPQKTTVICDGAGQ